MGKPKKKLTREEKLAKDRIRKKLKYEEIKNNPELYAIQQEKERSKYLQKKERKKVLSIQEMTERGKREQRRRWRQNTKKYSKKIKEQKHLQRILVQNSPPESETEFDRIDNEEREPTVDPLAEPAVDPLAEPTVDPLVEPTAASQLKKNRSSSTPNMTAKPSLLDIKSENKEYCNISATFREKLRRKIRYKDLKIIKLDKKLAESEKEREILEKQLKDMKKEENKTAVQLDTLEKKVEEIVKDIKADKIEGVKKKLLFTETVARRFTSKYETLSKKEKRPFAEELLKDKEKFKKYQVFTKLPFTLKQKAAENSLGMKTKLIKRQVQSFFEEDVNSQVAAGKYEYIKRGGKKMQKRYITDNLKNLHTKYCNQFGYVGYSTFCKYRPFWIVFPNDKRDTCQCKIHANVELLVKALKRANIIRETSTTEVMASLCCDVYDQKCLERTCQNCSEKVLEYLEFDDSAKIKYCQWLAEKQTYIPSGKDSTEKTKNMTIKKKLEDHPRNLINKLDTLLITFFQHARNILVQYRSVKDLKQNLTQEEVICHIDFSENYAMKYHEEVQSHHFVREQLSLHTGVLYYRDSQKKLATKSFCTASECLNHDANAIWAHLVPILNIASNLVRKLRSIHFVSDSPSSQYRNRFIFHMISQLQKQIPSLEEVTWNYLESGHGKGAPDGIGAVVKRTADSFVKFGGDVANIEDFVTTVKDKVQNVHVEIISKEEIRKNKFPTCVPGFKGTTKVHQVIWCLDLPHSVAFRALSCFICRSSYLPCDHHKHLGVLSVAIPIAETQTETACYSVNTRAMKKKTDRDLDDMNGILYDEEIETTNANVQQIPQNENCVDVLEENRFLGTNSDFDVGSPLQIDSPTIFNNVGNMLLNEFDGTMFVEDILTKSVSGDSLKNPPKVQILSNIPVSFKKKTDSTKVLKNVVNILANDTKLTSSSKNLSSLERTKRNDSASSKSFHQKAFENFLQSSSLDWPSDEVQSNSLNNSNAAKDTILQIRTHDHDIGTKSMDNVSKNIINITQASSDNHDIQTTAMDIDSLDLKYNITNSVNNSAQGTVSQIRTLDHAIETKSMDNVSENIINITQASSDNHDIQTTAMDIDSVELKYNIDMWVVVEYKVKNNSKHFVGKITETILATKEYKILFVRKAQGKNMKFGWPNVTDEDTVSENQIMQCLKDPKENRRGQFTFEDLPNVKF